MFAPTVRKRRTCGLEPPFVPEQVACVALELCFTGVALAALAESADTADATVSPAVAATSVAVAGPYPAELYADTRTKYEFPLMMLDTVVPREMLRFPITYACDESACPVSST